MAKVVPVTAEDEADTESQLPTTAHADVAKEGARPVRIQVPSKPEGHDTPPGNISSYWWLGLLLLPLSIPVTEIALLLSWPYLLIKQTYIACSGGKIAKCLLFFLMVWLCFAPLALLICFFLVLFAQFPEALNIATDFEFTPLQYCALFWLWPQGNRTKIREAGAARCVHSLKRLTGLKDHESAEAHNRRKKSRELSKSTLCSTSDDNPIDSAKRLIKFGENGSLTPDSADPDWPDVDGKTMLYHCCKNGDVEAVEFLLSARADPNIRDNQTFLRGTALHAMVQTNSKFKESHVTILKALMRHEGTDPCVFSDSCCTPYMLAVRKKKEDLFDHLAPSPSWDELVAVLPETCPEHAEDVCNNIYDLIASTWECRSCLLLKVPDMLFCSNEGSEESLKARRVLLFERFLKPMMAQSVKGPMEKTSILLLRHVYAGMAGPPDFDGNVRDGYEQEYKAALKCAKDIQDAQYSEVRDELLKSPSAEALFDEIPKKECFVDDDELYHGRFMAAPRFAFTRDLAEAARELQNVGMLDSPDAMCDLMQGGRHEAMKIPRKDLLQDSNTDEFWMTLVLLWSIGVHRKMLPAFQQAMTEVAKATGSGFLEIMHAPVKAFERSMDKTLKDYKEGLDGSKGWNVVAIAPLYVIDMLRCSFVVDSVEASLEVGRRLEEKFFVARTKNGHKRENNSYADRKYNLVFQDSNQALLCEVQILIKRYIEIKEFGHLLYEFER